MPTPRSKRFTILFSFSIVATLLVSVVLWCSYFFRVAPVYPSFFQPAPAPVRFSVSNPYTKSRPNGLSSQDIVISIVTSTNTASGRVPVLQQLLSSFPEAAGMTILYFSDMGTGPFETLDTHISTGQMKWIRTPCSDDHTNGLCCKTAASYEYMFANYIDKKWFVHLADDTFCHVSNLISFLDYFNSDQEWYLGERYQRPPDHDYADGGAGWILSKGSLTKVAPAMPQFLAWQGSCYDDVVFGYLMQRNLRIPLHQAGGIHNEDFEILGCDSTPCPDSATLKLHVYHQFHAGHTAVESKPVTFHMRIGVQAGISSQNDGRKNAVTENTFGLLKSVIDVVSRNLPDLTEREKELAGRGPQ